MKKLSIFFLLLLCNQAFAEECITRRMAMDVGSGSLKSALYEYDKCENRIHQKIATHTLNLKYEKCLQPDNDDVVISSDCIHNTKRDLRRLQLRYGIKCGVDADCSGVATAWARKASNADEVLDLYRKSDMRIFALAQEDEGALGFYTLASHVDLDPDKYDDVFVFDIGGGSFQLSTKIGLKIRVLKGPNGVESFYKYLNQKFNKSEDDPYFTRDEIEQAVSEVAEKTKKMVVDNQEFAEKLRKHKPEVYAIGRPMNLGIKKQMGLGGRVTKNDLFQAALKYVGKKPEEIQDFFPKMPDHYLHASQASLIIVQGIMEGAGIDVMLIEDANPVDYIAKSLRYWHKES